MAIRRTTARRDEGFSVIEVSVALAIFALVATFLTQLLGVGFRGVLLGKRREVATQEANRVLEIARSLSYDAIGLVQSDPTIAQDTANITSQGGVLSFRPDEAWEPIMWAPNATNHPYDPHITNVVRGSTALTVHVYVTGVDGDADGEVDLKRVTVRVSWADDAPTGANNEVRAQTLINAEGLVACQQPCDGSGPDALTPLRAETFASGGVLRVDSSLLGLSAPLDITLPTSSGESTYRLVSDARCTTHSAGLQITDALDLPGYSVTARADNDAATQTPSDPPESTDTGVLAIPAGPARDLLGPSVGSPVACDAAVAPLPTEDGTASPLSALNAQKNVTALGGLLNWLLTVASASTAPITQEIVNETVAGQREAAGDADAAFGTVQLLKIPGVIGSGVLQIDALAYGASVRAAAGTPSAAPAVSAPAFTVRVFDNGNKLGATCATAAGTGITANRSGSYCVLTVTPGTAGFVGKQITLTHNFTQLVGLDIVNLAYTTTVDLLPPATGPAAGVDGPNGERRWSAEYTPMAVSASLDASVLGAPLIDVDVEMNLGSVKADACAGAACI